MACAESESRGRGVGGRGRVPHMSTFPRAIGINLSYVGSSRRRVLERAGRLDTILSFAALATLTRSPQPPEQADDRSRDRRTTVFSARSYCRARRRRGRRVVRRRSRARGLCGLGAGTGRSATLLKRGHTFRDGSIA